MKPKYGFGHPKYIQRQIRNAFNRYDTDHDGSPDKIDCQPLNPRYQHLTPTMRKRIYEQPIYMAYNSGSSETVTTYHISDKGMPPTLKKERQKVLSVMSQRPDIIGGIERTKPKSVVFTRGMTTREKETLGAEVDKRIVVRTTYPKSRGLQHEQDVYAEHHVRSPEAQLIGSTTVHETEHVRQERSYHGKRYKKLFKGSHDQQKGEKLAYEAERRSIRKRYQLPEEEDTQAYMSREFD